MVASEMNIELLAMSSLLGGDSLAPDRRYHASCKTNKRRKEANQSLRKIAHLSHQSLSNEARLDRSESLSSTASLPSAMGSSPLPSEASLPKSELPLLIRPFLRVLGR